jgi:hypothetical protein
MLDWGYTIGFHLSHLTKEQNNQQEVQPQDDERSTQACKDYVSLFEKNLELKRENIVLEEQAQKRKLVPKS